MRFNLPTNSPPSPARLAAEAAFLAPPSYRSDSGSENPAVTVIVKRRRLITLQSSEPGGTSGPDVSSPQQQPASLHSDAPSEPPAEPHHEDERHPRVYRLQHVPETIPCPSEARPVAAQAEPADVDTGPAAASHSALSSSDPADASTVTPASTAVSPAQHTSVSRRRRRDPNTLPRLIRHVVIAAEDLHRSPEQPVLPTTHPTEPLHASPAPEPTLQELKAQLKQLEDTYLVIESLNAWTLEDPLIAEQYEAISRQATSLAASLTQERRSFRFLP